MLDWICSAFCSSYCTTVATVCLCIPVLHSGWKSLMPCFFQKACETGINSALRESTTRLQPAQYSITVLIVCAVFFAEVVLTRRPPYFVGVDSIVVALPLPRPLLNPRTPLHPSLSPSQVHHSGRHPAIEKHAHDGGVGGHGAERTEQGHQVRPVRPHEGDGVHPPGQGVQGTV